MSRLLDRPPYDTRDDPTFLAELEALVRHHRAGCAELARIWPQIGACRTAQDVPFVHVGLFKKLRLVTQAPGIRHERLLLSSATTGTGASMVQLDEQSTQLQSRSAQAILADFVGPTPRPLLVLDGLASLRRQREVSARIAAAMSLRQLATDLHFVLADPDNPASVKWDMLGDILSSSDDFLMYGLTWMLYFAFGAAEPPRVVRERLAEKRFHFVHSGGWKKLETRRIDRAAFDAALLRHVHPDSRVTDYYGLVEQVGIVYPLCEHGYRHAPVWAEVLVRHPSTLVTLTDRVGQLQLLNVLSLGAPSISVLTEDLGRVVPGDCACGRRGRRFELVGRIPRADMRGCANV